MRAIPPLLAVAAVLCAAPALAGFDDGLAAYDGGRYGEAVAHWAPLAEAGDGEARVALAGLYRQGLGVAADAARAARLYRLAAEQGLAIAQVNIGEMRERGEGVPRDLVRAWVWYRLAADRNSWAAARAETLAERLSDEERARAEALLAAAKSP